MVIGNGIASQQASHHAMSIRAQVAPIQHVKKVWERIAPLHLADKSWDNVGGPFSQLRVES